MSQKARRSSDELRTLLEPIVEKAATTRVGNHAGDSLRSLAELGEGASSDEQATAATEAMACYRAVITTTADGFFMADATGRLLEANDIYTLLCGYTHAELGSMSITDLEAKATLAEMSAHFERARKHGWDRFETIHAAKDGTQLPVDIRTSYLAICGGRFFTFVRDLRERQYVEQAHRESEEQSRATFEQAAVGMAHVALPTSDTNPTRARERPVGRFAVEESIVDRAVCVLTRGPIEFLIEGPKP